MFSWLRRAFQRLAVSSKITHQMMNTHRRSKLLVGGSFTTAAAAASASMWIYNTCFVENHEVVEDEDDIKYKELERREMMRILHEVFKIERDGPEVFSKANNGKSVYEILYPERKEDD